MTCRDLLLAWLARTVNVFLALADTVLNVCVGVTLGHGTRVGCAAAKEYGSSAHLAKLRFGASPVNYLGLSLGTYVCTHVRYVHPDYALRENVCLWFFDGDKAVFAVCDEEASFYDTQAFPFLFMSLEKLARHLLIMPIKSLHRLADDIGDPKANVKI